MQLINTFKKLYFFCNKADRISEIFGVISVDTCEESRSYSIRIAQRLFDAISALLKSVLTTSAIQCYSYWTSYVVDTF